MPKPPKPLTRPVRLEGGTLYWSDGSQRNEQQQRQLLRAAMRHLPDGPYVWRLEPYAETRRERQSRYYFGVVVKMIAEETGHTKDQIHELLKAMFLAETIELANPLTGEVTERRIVKSSASLKVGEFADYVTQCQVWAAEFLGLMLPEAEPDVKARRAA